MTQATAPQHPAQQTHRARVYQAASGEWAWSIDLAGDPFARGAGFESGMVAEDDLYEHLQRPYSLIMEHDPDAGVIYGPVLDGDVVTQAAAPHKTDDSIWLFAKPLLSCTCHQCHGSGYLDGAIECPNCFGHGEVFQLDDVEVSE